MAKQQIITIDKTVDKIVKSIQHNILQARRSIFAVCKELADLRSDDENVYSKVIKKLQENNIMSKSMISEYTKIGSVRNGFLVVHQDKLPLAYKTLLTIAKNIEDDDNFKRFKIELKTNSFNTIIEKEVSDIFTAEEGESDSEEDLFSNQVKQIEKKTKKREDELSISIYLPSDIFFDKTKKKKTTQDYKKIKSLMKYARFEEHGSLEDTILNDEE